MASSTFTSSVRRKKQSHEQFINIKSTAYGRRKPAGGRVIHSPDDDADEAWDGARGGMSSQARRAMDLQSKLRMRQATIKAETATTSSPSPRREAVVATATVGVSVQARQSFYDVTSTQSQSQMQRRQSSLPPPPRPPYPHPPQATSTSTQSQQSQSQSQLQQSLPPPPPPPYPPPPTSTPRVATATGGNAVHNSPGSSTISSTSSITNLSYSPVTPSDSDSPEATKRETAKGSDSPGESTSSETLKAYTVQRESSSSSSEITPPSPSTSSSALARLAELKSQKEQLYGELRRYEIDFVAKHGREIDGYKDILPVQAMYRQYLDIKNEYLACKKAVRAGGSKSSGTIKSTGVSSGDDGNGGRIATPPRRSLSKGRYAYRGTAAGIGGGGGGRGNNNNNNNNNSSPTMDRITESPKEDEEGDTDDNIVLDEDSYYSRFTSDEDEDGTAPDTDDNVGDEDGQRHEEEEDADDNVGEDMSEEKLKEEREPESTTNTGKSAYTPSADDADVVVSAVAAILDYDKRQRKGTGSESKSVGSKSTGSRSTVRKRRSKASRSAAMATPSPRASSPTNARRKKMPSGPLQSPEKDAASEISERSTPSRTPMSPPFIDRATQSRTLTRESEANKAAGKLKLSQLRPFEPSSSIKSSQVSSPARPPYRPRVAASTTASATSATSGNATKPKPASPIADERSTASKYSGSPYRPRAAARTIASATSPTTTPFTPTKPKPPSPIADERSSASEYSDPGDFVVIPGVRSDDESMSSESSANGSDAQPGKIASTRGTSSADAGDGLPAVGIFRVKKAADARMRAPSRGDLPFDETNPDDEAIPSLDSAKQSVATPKASASDAKVFDADFQRAFESFDSRQSDIGLNSINLNAHSSSSLIRAAREDKTPGRKPVSSKKKGLDVVEDDAARQHKTPEREPQSPEQKSLDDEDESPTCVSSLGMTKERPTRGETPLIPLEKPRSTTGRRNSSVSAASSVTPLGAAIQVKNEETRSLSPSSSSTMSPPQYASSLQDLVFGSGILACTGAEPCASQAYVHSPTNERATTSVGKKQTPKRQKSRSGAAKQDKKRAQDQTKASIDDAIPSIARIRQVMNDAVGAGQKEDHRKDPPGRTISDVFQCRPSDDDIGSISDGEQPESTEEQPESAEDAKVEKAAAYSSTPIMNVESDGTNSFIIDIADRTRQSMASGERTEEDLTDVTFDELPSWTAMVDDMMKTIEDGSIYDKPMAKQEKQGRSSTSTNTSSDQDEILSNVKKDAHESKLTVALQELDALKEEFANISDELTQSNQRLEKLEELIEEKDEIIHTVELERDLAQADVKHLQEQIHQMEQMEIERKAKDLQEQIHQMEQMEQMEMQREEKEAKRGEHVPCPSKSCGICQEKDIEIRTLKMTIAGLMTEKENAMIARKSSPLEPENAPSDEESSSKSDMVPTDNAGSTEDEGKIVSEATRIHPHVEEDHPAPQDEPPSVSIKPILEKDRLAQPLTQQGIKPKHTPTRIETCEKANPMNVTRETTAISFSDESSQESDVDDKSEDDIELKVSRSSDIRDVLLSHHKPSSGEATRAKALAICRKNENDPLRVESIPACPTIVQQVSNAYHYVDADDSPKEDALVDDTAPTGENQDHASASHASGASLRNLGSMVSKSSIASLDTNKAVELDQLVDQGDWEGVVLATAKYEAELSSQERGDGGVDDYEPHSIAEKKIKTPSPYNDGHVSDSDSVLDEKKNLPKRLEERQEDEDLRSYLFSGQEEQKNCDDVEEPKSATDTAESPSQLGNSSGAISQVPSEELAEYVKRRAEEEQQKLHTDQNAKKQSTPFEDHKWMMFNPPREKTCSEHEGVMDTCCSDMVQDVSELFHVEFSQTNKN